MRLAILADVHANLPALEAVLADMDRQADVETIVVAGDMVTGGPQPRKTLDLLRARHCRMIRGNGEGYLMSIMAGTLPGWSSGVHWAPTRWTYQALGQEQLDFLASLPKQMVVAGPGGRAIRIVHGSPQESDGMLYPDRDPAALQLFRDAHLLVQDAVPPSLDSMLAGVAEPVLVCGHTHIPWQQTWSRGLAVNPGSVGAPLTGDSAACYALLAPEGDGWRVEQRRVPYDLKRLRDAFRESGCLAEGGGFARAFMRNAETGRNFVGQFVEFVYRLAERQGSPVDPVVPDEIWQQAESRFDWSD